MKSKRKRIALLTAGMAVLLIFSIVFNVLSVAKFDNIFEKALGATSFRLKGDTLGADVDYLFFETFEMDAADFAGVTSLKFKAYAEGAETEYGAEYALPLN